jgi:ribosomal protein S4
VASINYLMNRVHTYPITNEEKTKELNIIQDTLYNNKYNNKNLNIRHPRNKKHNNKNTRQQHQTTKWAMFTYYGKETKEIAKLFKETNINT